MSKSVVDALIEARGLIEIGWIKGWARRVVNGGACYCALGAIGETDTTLDDYRGALDFVYAALPVGYTSIARFNDYHTTTKADVLALYDRAIKAAKADAGVGAA